MTAGNFVQDLVGRNQSGALCLKLSERLVSGFGCQGFNRVANDSDTPLSL
jgi:hypothetical protein